jgi:hypothetical protein
MIDLLAALAVPGVVAIAFRAGVDRLHFSGD